MLVLALSAFILIILGLMLAWSNLKSGDNQDIDDINAYTPAVPVETSAQSPELNLTNLKGEPVSLLDYRGKTILVNNWAFWCPPCRAELPELQAYYKKHKNQDFVIIGIESGSELEDVDYHVKKYKLSYPIWLDPIEQAVLAFQNNALPNSYVIDPDGKIVLMWSGPANRQILEKYITPFLEK